MYIGIDLGGTNIKVALIDKDANILAQDSCPTALPRSPELVCDDIISLMQEILAKKQLTIADLGGIGLGCPGKIDDETGVVVYSNNLAWENFPIRRYFKDRLGVSIQLGNDANVAALGEVYAGSAKGTESAVIITLGTGVGSGVVLNGKILTGYGRGASEIGHMVICDGGIECTCGRHGCLESYASATALIREAKSAITQHPTSTLASMAAELGEVTGKLVFDAADTGDSIAQQVIDQYIHYLACGITNILNIFQPQIVCLSGGISKQGEKLLAPLRKKVYPAVFGGQDSRTAELAICTLGHNAGIIGAAMLCL